MAKRLNRDEAKLHLVYLVARSDFKSGGWFGIGEGDLITDEEEKYLESVSKKEKKNKRNNLIVSAAALSAVAVFGIILTL